MFKTKISGKNFKRFWDQKIISVAGSPTTVGGISISGDGNVIAVGSRGGSNPASGSIYVYRWTGSDWDGGTQLTPSGETGLDIYFGVNGRGISLSYDGSVLVCSSTRDTGASPRGEIYIYRYSGSWSQEITFYGSAVSPGYFGTSVAISSNGNNVVGDEPGTGKVYIYKYTGSWDGGTALSRPNPVGGASKVAVNGDGTVVAGSSPMEDSNLGAVFVFRYSGSWSSYIKLQWGSLPAGWKFGAGLAMSYSGSWIIASTGKNSYQTPEKVIIYYYNGSSWVVSGQVLQDERLHLNVNLGTSISMSPGFVHLGFGCRNIGAGSTPGGQKAVYRLNSSSAWVANLVAESTICTSSSGGYCANFCMSSDAHVLVSTDWTNLSIYRGNL